MLDGNNDCRSFPSISRHLSFYPQNREEKGEGRIKENDWAILAIEPCSVKQSKRKPPQMGRWQTNGNDHMIPEE